MLLIRACALLLLTASVAAAADLPKGVKVHDGDTIRASIRVENVDTPEIDGKCARERDLAQRAKRFTTDWMARHAGRVTIRASKVDRYGRVVALVSAGGEDLGEMLIAAGLARRWTGRREPWC
jgi:micrococcal nuclease